MKKIIMLFVMSIVMISVTGCSSDDNSTPTFNKADLFGSWEHVSSKVFDPKKKLLGEAAAENKDNCGVLVMSFTESQMGYVKYEGKDYNGNCIEVIDMSGYELRGNRIYEKDENGDLDEDVFLDIKSLNGNTLVLFQKLEKPFIYNGIAFQYLEMYMRRVK
ncbi:hypothetical protein [Myroides sp. N17-2]|uniref:hypothetical protein n=1 Tax=Myroides sp. N17-2 TaxID=2030799 RepID=UPI000EFC7C77|nr:hypothetical protein [Myroides sp. N17-2]